MKTLTTTFTRNGNDITATFGHADRVQLNNGKKHLDNITHTHARKQAHDCEISQAVQAYIMEKSPLLALTAVKTILSNQWQEKLYQCYCELADIINHGYTTKAVYMTDNDKTGDKFNDWTEFDYCYHDNAKTAFNIDERMNDTNDTYAQRYYEQLLYAQNNIESIDKLHTYTMRKTFVGDHEKLERLQNESKQAIKAYHDRIDIERYLYDNYTHLLNAHFVESDTAKNLFNVAMSAYDKYNEYKKECYKMKRFECVPYTTTERTAYGRIMDECDIIEDVDALDIIQECATAMIELYKSGVIYSFGCFMHYRYYVYRKVNQYIGKQRKQSAIAPSSLVNVDENGKEKIIDIKAVDNCIDKVDKMQVHKAVLSCILRNLHKTANRENIAYTYMHTYIYNDSRVDIAHDLRVDEKAVRRYIDYINRELAQNDEIKDSLSYLLA